MKADIREIAIQDMLSKYTSQNRAYKFLRAAIGGDMSLFPAVWDDLPESDIPRSYGLRDLRIRTPHPKVAAYEAALDPHLALRLSDVADWIENGLEQERNWTRKTGPDGIPLCLTGGFNAVLAQARESEKKRHWEGPQRQAAQAKHVRWEGDIYGCDFMAGDAAEILTHNLTGDLSIYFGRNGVTMREENSGLVTHWEYSRYNRQVQYAGWRYGNTGEGNAKQLMANRIAYYQALGMTQMRSRFGIVGSYAFARYGFKPFSDNWNYVRSTARERLDSFGFLPGEVRNRIVDILDDPDPRAIWRLADERYAVEGKPIGFRLLQNNGWTGTVDFNDREQMTRLRDYIGPDIFDDAMEHAERVVKTAKARKGPTLNAGQTANSTLSL